MAGARMLFSPRNTFHDDEPASFDDRNNGRHHLRVYVDTPPAMSRRGTFMTGNYISPPTSAQELGQGPGLRRWTQADQTRVDSEKKRKAMKELVTSWQDRLQLISIITTFFAGMEAQLLGIVTPEPGAMTSKISQASLIGLSSALVVHTFAAILSFIAAFFLVRFRVHEATHEEVKAELGVTSITSDSQKGQSGATGNGTAAANGDATTGGLPATIADIPIFSTDPHLEQVGPFRKHEPPIVLLDRCHLLCMFFSMIGFILAMLGIMCYVWARLPLSARVVTSTFGGFSIALGVAATFVPTSFKPIDRSIKSPFMPSNSRLSMKTEQDKLPPGLEDSSHSQSV